MSPRGTYEYAVPIEVPAGFGGLQPRLALKYSSQAGDTGIAHGWTLTGISRLHRCSRTWAIDGTQDGVDLDDYGLSQAPFSKDALCLDGKRLVEISTDEFRTEEETFARVLRHSDNAATWFEVFEKGGRVVEYRPWLQDGVEMGWQVASERDRTGNTITYAYDSTYPTLPVTITYGGVFLVELLWQAPAQERFLAGEKIPAGAALDQVKVLGPSADGQTIDAIRTYFVGYSTGSAPRSQRLLTSLQMCARGTCTQPKEFHYDERSGPRWQLAQTRSALPPKYESAAMVFDVDGDGRDDIGYVSRNPVQLNEEDTVFYMSRGFPGVDLQRVQNPGVDALAVVPVDLDGDGRIEVAIREAVNGVSQWSFKRWDEAAQGFVATGFTTIPISGDAQDIPGAWESIGFADLDGDGSADLIKPEDLLVDGAYVPKLTVRMNQGGMLSAPSVVNADVEPTAGFAAMDLCGNGRAGMYPLFKSPTYIYTDDAGQLVGSALPWETIDWQTRRQFPQIDPDPDLYRERFWADLNGDGLPDLVTAPGAGSSFSNYLQVEMNPGLYPCNQHLASPGGGFPSFSSPITNLDSAPDDKHNFLPVDVDNDGRDELIVYPDPDQDTAPQAYVLFYRDDRSFEAEDLTLTLGLAPGTNRINALRAGDFDGDGKVDLAVWSTSCDGNGTPQWADFAWNCGAGNSSFELRIFTQTSAHEGLLTEVREQGNLRASEEITYDVWHPDPGAGACGSFPQQCARSPLTVVASRGVLNPSLGDEFSSDRSFYTYEDPRFDLQGRGFQGFGVVRTWYPNRPQEVTSTYRHGDRVGTKYPFADLPDTVTTVVPILSVPQSGRLDASTQPATATARITQRTSSYVLNTGSAPQTWWVSPSAWETIEWEHDVAIDWSDVPQHISGFGPPRPYLRRRFGSMQYDDYGNLKKETTTTEGGTRSETEMTYGYRLSDWLIGLRKTVRERSWRVGAANPITRTRSYKYDGLGRLERVKVEPTTLNSELRKTTVLERNSNGLVNKITHWVDGELPRQLQVDYGSAGLYPEVVWNALGHGQWTSFDLSSGAPLARMDANGVTTRWAYDGVGRLRELHPPGSATVTHTYQLREDARIDPVTHSVIDGYAGTVEDISDTAGAHQIVFADELGREVERVVRQFDDVQWAEGAHTYIDYDVLGRTREVSKPAINPQLPGPLGGGRQTRTEQDSLDRLVLTTWPDATTTVSTHTFLDTLTTDALGQQTKVIRDLDGRIRQSIAYVNGQALATDYSYAEFDQLEATTDPLGNQIVVHYDRIGRRVSTDDPDAGKTTYLYNGFGDTTVMVAPGGSVTTNKYDEAGRLGHSTHSLDGTTDYNWGLGDRLLDTTSPDSVVTAFGYDTAGRQDRVDTSVDGTTFTVERGFDPHGRLQSVKYPQTVGWPRFTVEHSYNPGSYLAEVIDASDAANKRVLWKVSDMTPENAIRSAVYANGIDETRLYESTTARLLGIDAKLGNQHLFQLSYGYDDIGRMKTRDDTIQLRSETFDYDELSRLTGWHIGMPHFGRHTGYQYDDIGNLSQVTLNGAVSESYSFGANGLPHALTGDMQAGSYQYDPEGRLYADPSRNAVYTAFNLPHTISDSAGVTEFAYDAQRTRVKKEGPFGTTVYVGGLYEKRGLGGVDEHVFYVHGGDGVVAEVHYGPSSPVPTTYYVVRDALGSVGVVTDAAGQELQRDYYEPFGKRVDAHGGAQVTATESGLGFTGHRHDDELGLIDMRGRVYDPVRRRFLTPDPNVTDPLRSTSYNRYAYVMNSPLNYVDPSGLDFEGSPGADCYACADNASWGPGGNDHQGPPNYTPSVDPNQQPGGLTRNYTPPDPPKPPAPLPGRSDSKGWKGPSVPGKSGHTAGYCDPATASCGEGAGHPESYCDPVDATCGRDQALLNQNIAEFREAKLTALGIAWFLMPQLGLITHVGAYYWMGDEGIALSAGQNAQAALVTGGSAEAGGVLTFAPATPDGRGMLRLDSYGSVSTVVGAIAGAGPGWTFGVQKAPAFWGAADSINLGPVGLNLDLESGSFNGTTFGVGGTANWFSWSRSFTTGSGSPTKDGIMDWEPY